MSAPQTLLQAAVNRLAARLGSGLADTAAGLAVIAQEAPARLQQELSLFWDEVEQEAERLETGAPTADSASGGGAAAQGPPADPQDQIDALRARVADLASRLDRTPQGPA
jgi:uncharacterized protein YceH (UPF0502 family)